MKTILATGGLGFIGSHTCISLIKKGYDVLIVDSLVNSKLNDLSKIKDICTISKTHDKGEIFFEKGDIRDRNWLYQIFEDFKKEGRSIDAVIHFAGLKSVEESILSPLRYWDENLNITLSLLSVMDQFDCKTLVFSSSATIYKTKLNKKIDEDSFTEPINAYGNTKLAIEKILLDLSRNSQSFWKIANLRYFNPVGAHSTSLIGEDPKNKANNIFPIIIKVLEKKLDKLSIFGKDWPTPDGTCVRDYIHVMDLADSHVAALRFLISNDPQVINLNIGTGEGTSVLELVKKFNEVNNCKIPFEFSDRREGDSPFVVADNSLALKLLDWEPNMSLEDICKDTWNWFIKKNKN